MERIKIRQVYFA